MHLKLIELYNIPIYSQLLLEEALLRADSGNYCLINYGSPPAIVMGISGKAEVMVDLHYHSQHPIPLIKRFSGGGTVVIDPNTLFVTLICNEGFHQSVAKPGALMEWTGELYAPLLSPLPFAVRENDYVIGELKFGGNAQYIRKGRWLHHTSFLWDYSPEKMSYLKHPPKMPRYRNDRKHTDFLTCLNQHFHSKEQLVESIKARFHHLWEMETAPIESLEEIYHRPHRRGTKLVLHGEKELDVVSTLFQSVLK